MRRTTRSGMRSRGNWIGRPGRDDRGLPDLQFAFYDGVVVFDHVDKIVYAVRLVQIPAGADSRTIESAYNAGVAALETRVGELQADSKHLSSGRMDRAASKSGTGTPLPSNMTRAEHARMLSKALVYIRAGDIFQVVLGQRFERKSKADPFDVYRVLRAVNPSPYMVYMQTQGCILVASSPEILCRVRKDAALGRGGVVTEPAAGGNATARGDSGGRPGLGTRTAGRSEGAGRAHHAGGPWAERRRHGRQAGDDQGFRR